jgi:hypothetical protein
MKIEDIDEPKSTIFVPSSLTRPVVQFGIAYRADSECLEATSNSQIVSESVTYITIQGVDDSVTFQCI